MKLEPAQTQLRAPQAKNSEGLVVPAAGQGDPRVAAGQAVQLRGGAGAFLDRDDVAAAGDGGEERLVHLHAHPRRIVVEHDRQAGGAIHRQHVLGDLPRGRQRVGRRADQDGVGADGAGGFGVGQRVLGADRAGSHHQRQAPGDDFAGVGGEGQAFLGGVRVVLAGGAADHDAVHLRLDEKLQDLGEGLGVDAAVGAQRGDGGGIDTFEFHGGSSCGMLGRGAPGGRCRGGWFR